MLEIIIRKYLEENLDVPVVLEKPAEKPEMYVVVHRIDGGNVDHISAGTLSVICIAKTMYQALELSHNVKKLLNESISLSSISSAKQGGENGSAVSSERGYEYELIYNFYYYEYKEE